MKRSPLSRVEGLIRKMVEEPFTWLNGGALDPFQLATHLTRYYDLQPAEQPQPNHFTVTISPRDYKEIEQGIATLERQVADYIVVIAGRRGNHLKAPPDVSIEQSESEKDHSAHVRAEYKEKAMESGTAVYAFEGTDATQEAIRAADAFLIVQGRQHISLDRPIIRIGRRVDNDIVLDSPSISRQHAQIRWRQRYFVLYDVSSHSRTYVNGTPVAEHILRPGDVIALSDVFLVYGEGRDDILSVSSFTEQDEMDSTMLKPEE
jgi:hypothetical protein